MHHKTDWAKFEQNKFWIFSYFPLTHLVAFYFCLCLFTFTFRFLWSNMFIFNIVSLGATIWNCKFASHKFILVLLHFYFILLWWACCNSDSIDVICMCMCFCVFSQSSAHVINIVCVCIQIKAKDQKRRVATQFYQVFPFIYDVAQKLVSYHKINLK